MTKVYFGEMDLCTFCRNAHQRWGKNHKFNKARKEAVKICFCCKEGMCQDCVDESQEELKGHMLQKFGLDICYSCISTVRTDHALKPRLEQAAREAIEYAREQIEIKIYSLTHEHA